MADVKNFKSRLSSSRMFNYVKGESKDFNNKKVDDKFYNYMTASYETQDYLNDSMQFSFTAPLIYQLDLLKEDIDDIHQHLSESKFTSKKQKFPVVDVTNEFYVTGTTSLEGNTTISGFTDIRGAFKVNGTEISDLKKSLDYARALEATGVTSTEFDYLDGVTSNIQTQINNAGGSSFTAAGISGSFTSLSASIATDINNAGGGTVETALKDGSTNAVTNNAVFDGLATKLNLSGGTMTGLIQPVVATVKSALNKNTLDARATNVFQFNSKQAIAVDLARAAHVGQEMTIVNLGQGAVRITHQGKPIQTSFFIYGGSNLTIATAQVYKFVYTAVNQWLLIQ